MQSKAAQHHRNYQPVGDVHEYESSTLVLVLILVSGINASPDGLGGSNQPLPSRCLFLMPRSKEPLEAGCCVLGFRPPEGHTGQVSASKHRPLLIVFGFMSLLKLCPHCKVWQLTQVHPNPTFTRLSGGCITRVRLHGSLYLAHVATRKSLILLTSMNLAYPCQYFHWLFVHLPWYFCCT